MRRLVGLTVVFVVVATLVVVACWWLLQCRARTRLAASTGAVNTTDTTAGNITVLQAETFDLRLRRALEPLARYEVRYRGNLAKSGQRLRHVLGAYANSWEIGGRPENDEPQDVPLYAIIDLAGIATNADGSVKYSVRLEVASTCTNDELKELLVAVEELGRVNITSLNSRTSLTKKRVEARKQSNRSSARTSPE